MSPSNRGRDVLLDSLARLRRRLEVMRTQATLPERLERLGFHHGTIDALRRIADPGRLPPAIHALVTTALEASCRAVDDDANTWAAHDAVSCERPAARPSKVLRD